MLLLVDHNNIKLNDNTYNLLTACSKLSNQIDILLCVSGDSSPLISHCSSLVGLRSIILCSNSSFDHEIGENIANVIVQLQAKKK